MKGTVSWMGPGPTYKFLWAIMTPSKLKKQKEVRDHLFWRQIKLTRAWDSPNSISYHGTGSGSFYSSRTKSVRNQDMPDALVEVQGSCGQLGTFLLWALDAI
ncbi:rCG20503 [Rattus norvegicus]|uniref:RCG20503 n=1 Tax=Rattus norvegicus TaxID=10116 RepID=A6JGX1_RAT|nr:rCG20503 [Rattus norvegicus]